MSDTIQQLPEMVRVHGGGFQMGSPANEIGRADSESPVHQVRITYSFDLGKYPVTFAEWDAAIVAGAKLHNPDDGGWGRGSAPVVNVSWHDARAYIAWLSKQSGHSYRLPSEAEWEFACRAGTTTRYPHGDDEERLQDYAWTALNSDDRTHPVGALKPNAHGLYDMIGNVWEWCEDIWHDAYQIETSDGYMQTAPIDGSAWMIGGDVACRALRGGSWEDVGPQVFRSADRTACGVQARRLDVGFRLAQTIT